MAGGAADAAPVAGDAGADAGAASSTSPGADGANGARSRSTVSLRSATLLTLPCGHTFHEACINEWASRERTCPICRADIPSRDEPAAISNTGVVDGSHVVRAMQVITQDIHIANIKGITLDATMFVIFVIQAYYSVSIVSLMAGVLAFFGLGVTTLRLGLFSNPRTPPFLRRVTILFEWLCLGRACCICGYVASLVTDRAPLPDDVVPYILVALSISALLIMNDVFFLTSLRLARGFLLSIAVRPPPRP